MEKLKVEERIKLLLLIKEKKDYLCEQLIIFKKDGIYAKVDEIIDEIEELNIIFSKL